MSRLRELLSIATERARAAGDRDTPVIQFLTADERAEKTAIQAAMKAEGK